MEFYYYYLMFSQFLEEHGLLAYLVFCFLFVSGFKFGFKILESVVKGR